MLIRLLNALNLQKVGFCFDTGHMSAYSETNMDDWLKALGPLMKELHLHDNDGIKDDHVAIGAGKIDFELLFEYIEQNSLKPITTIEAHKEKWLWQSLEALSRSERFCRIIQSY
jgi:sugar phosphate isomerase/epimerase